MKILFGARSFHLGYISSLIYFLSTGIAYTIDPAYEVEVRDYLGGSDITRLPQPTFMTPERLQRKSRPLDGTSVV
jgi:hypothetical protein